MIEGCLSVSQLRNMKTSSVLFLKEFSLERLVAGKASSDETVLPVRIDFNDL
mgnify:CR=1 FL=1